ncbi:hypothetical protein LINPERHAP2_LOCUS13750, partial [Linum perenne]
IRSYLPNQLSTPTQSNLTEKLDPSSSLSLLHPQHHTTLFLLLLPTITAATTAAAPPTPRRRRLRRRAVATSAAVPSPPPPCRQPSSLSLSSRPPPSPSSPPPPPPSPLTLNFPHNSSSFSLSLPLVSSIYVHLSGKAGNQSGICFPLASTTAKPGPDSSHRLIALGMGFAKGISSTVFTNRFTSFITPDFNRQPSWWIAARRHRRLRAANPAPSLSSRSPTQLPLSLFQIPNSSLLFQIPNPAPSSALAYATTIPARLRSPTQLPPRRFRRP